jgi:hypothetical protein
MQLEYSLTAIPELESSLCYGRREALFSAAGRLFGDLRYFGALPICLA